MGDGILLFDGLGIACEHGCQAIDAASLARMHYPAVNVGWPLAVGRVHDLDLATAVMRTLLAVYPSHHEVVVDVQSGDGAAPLHRVALGVLDQFGGFDASTSVYVPPLLPGHDIADLQETVAHLRAPEGCPWDREQTLSSLRQGLLSECVEVMEAIDLDDTEYDNGAHIAEELGDVLLVVMMMVQIAIDDGRFQMADVVGHIVSKLIRRHPHVFGDVVVTGSGEVTANWEAIKAQEKAEKGQRVESPLDGVPVHLPALEKARELQSKAAKAGLLDRSALARSMPGLAALLGPQPDDAAFGELLWVLTALAHAHGVVAENALRQYAVRYRQRVEDARE